MRDVYYGIGSGIPVFDLPTNLAIIAAEFVSVTLTDADHGHLPSAHILEVYESR